MLSEISLSEAQAGDWDVIIIGAGMGGGLAGRRLAERGLRVLFLEKGTKGYRREQQELNISYPDPEARRILGAWPAPAEVTVDGKSDTFFVSAGCGVGGTSVFYAGALERPERHDFEDTTDIAHPTGGWPVGYDAFRPYFELAERWLHIKGGPDPLSQEPAPNLGDPVPISAGEQAMYEDFQAQGIHPYRQHIAIRHLEGCTRCVGTKCPRPCKMDGRSAGVEPALETGNAALLADCDVRQIKDSSGTVTSLTVVKNGQEQSLKAKTYILSAGAYGSPRLLLSSGQGKEGGCANSSDWVGRGLMFHLDELFALWPRRGMQFDGASKAVSIRDLYTYQGKRLGMIQSMGMEASYGNIAFYLSNLFKRSILRHIPFLKYGLNLVALLAAKILGQAKIFVGIIEDFALPENRILLHQSDPDRIVFQYTIPAELLQRRRLFRRRLRKLFGKNRLLLLGQKASLNYGHPCGTLRFGTDPNTSVLDADCKTHDLDNLYVADASFMPSSMGVNPSLTIAANALRVADIIADRHGATKGELP